jgi:acetyl-CoA C-acetyltransferase
VGNFNAGLFTKQLHLGAFIPEIDEKLHGIPTMHTEAACASGALSVLLGAQWIMGGFHDAILVVGAEQQKTMSSRDGSEVLGAENMFGDIVSDLCAGLVGGLGFSPQRQSW